MKVSTILNKKGNTIHSISPDATLKNMVKDMLALSVGCLLVLNEDGSIAGIITERDFLHNVAKYPDTWEDVRVGDVMITDVFICSVDKTLEQVMTRMTEHRIRHMPVVDSAKKVIGLLSIGDIVNASLDETTFENKLLKNYIKNWPEEDNSEPIS
ncbi:MAG: CBS domain-containing protein [Gammaproteobacteria bacterium]